MLIEIKIWFNENEKEEYEEEKDVLFIPVNKTCNCKIGFKKFKICMYTTAIMYETQSQLFDFSSRFSAFNFIS